jgi:hypothetical protein
VEDPTCTDASSQKGILHHAGAASAGLWRP